MVMEKLIKFRLLSDSLSDDEFESFTTQLFNTFNKRTIILRSLVYLFHAQINKQDQQQTNQQINSLNEHTKHKQIQQNQDLITTINIISKIIQSRTNSYHTNKYSSHHHNSASISTEHEQKTGALSTVCTRNSSLLSFGDLPTELIGNCASYLTFYEYQKFQRISRQIFIGCNNPIPIQYIDRQIFTKCIRSQQYSKLSKFTKISYLELNVRESKQLQNNHALKWNNLRTLSLFQCDSVYIKDFLDTNESIQLSQIEVLKLHNFYKRYRRISNIEDHLKLFKRLLMEVKNLKFLELNGLSVTDRFNNDVFMRMFDNAANDNNGDEFTAKALRKLEGLCLYGTGADVVQFYNHLLSHFSDKLVSLHIDAVINEPSKGFGKLKELCVWGANYQKLHNIIKSAHNIERLHLEFLADHVNVITDEGKKKELEDILVNTLNMVSLEFISIKMDKDIGLVLNVLKRLEFKARKRLKIQFNIKQQIDKPEEYYLTLNGKLDLWTPVVRHWMIVFKCIATESMKPYHNNNALINGQAIVL